MKKEVLFTITKLNGTQLFELDGLFFDKLVAYYLFDGGKLTVFRNDVLIDETSDIYEFGTHGACMCFIGMKNCYATNSISPDQFQIGDALRISFDCNRDFDFKEFLKKEFIKHVAIMNAFRKMPSGRMDEFQKLFVKEVGKTIKNSAIAETNLLRFSWE